MTRLLLSTFLAFGVAASAVAQTSEAPTDSLDIVADSAAADTSAIELDPERARELYDEGTSQIQAGDYEGALETLNESLVYNPQYAAAQLRRGQALAQLRRLEDARGAFEEAIALADASDIGNADQIKGSAERALSQIQAALDAASAQAEAEAAAAGAQATAQKIEQATQMLAGNEITYEQATEAYALLEQARMDGYDPNSVAFYYAKALTAMERGADAVPYAQTAYDQTEGQDDRSSSLIVLAQAHLAAGDAQGARDAINLIEEDDAWAGWKAHYLSEADALEAEG